MIVNVGTRLLARPGTWKHAAPSGYTYQWQRGDEWGTTSSFSNIAGATNAERLVAAADETKTLRCAVTATNAFGTGTAYTPVGIVRDGRTDFARTFGYGPGGPSGKECVLAAYPAASASSPCLLMFHGGGFTEQDTSEEPAPGEKTGASASEAVGKMEVEGASENMQAKGWAVFNVNFRQDGNAITPGYTIELPDVQNAIAWVKANAEAFNGNPGRICLAGGSSGGSLALMAAVKLNEYKPGYVRGAASLSGLSDLATRVEDCLTEIAEAEAKEEAPDAHIGNHIRHVAYFSGIDKDLLKTPGWLAGNANAKALLNSISPFTFVGPGLPKIIYFISEGEGPVFTPVDQGTIMVAAATAVGRGSQIDFRERAGNGHSWAYFASDSPKVSTQVDEFLKAA